MLLMQVMGVDLFVVGGTSSYNGDLRRFRHVRGEDYLPLTWQAHMPYLGPAQAAEVGHVRMETSAGNSSLVDALIALGDDSAAGAFERLGAFMRGRLETAGVSYVPGQRDAADGVAA